MFIGLKFIFPLKISIENMDYIEISAPPSKYWTFLRDRGLSAAVYEDNIVPGYFHRKSFSKQLSHCIYESNVNLFWFIEISVFQITSLFS